MNTSLLRYLGIQLLVFTVFRSTMHKCNFLSFKVMSSFSLVLVLVSLHSSSHQFFNWYAIMEIESFVEEEFCTSKWCQFNNGVSQIDCLRSFYLDFRFLFQTLVLLISAMEQISILWSFVINLGLTNFSVLLPPQDGD